MTQEDIRQHSKQVMQSFQQIHQVLLRFALERSWRGRVGESSSSPEGRNNIERDARQG